jgi:hypothetical protein
MPEMQSGFRMQRRFRRYSLFFRHRFDKVGSMTVIRLTKNAPGRITAE